MTSLAAWPVMDWIFLICAVIGGVAFGIWLLLQFAGGALDTDVDADVDLDVHGDVGDVSGHADLSFTLLSFQGLSSFLTMFGLVGLTTHREMGLSAAMALISAAAAGSFMTWVISRMFRVFSNLQSSGTLDMNNAIGQQGQVYLRIKPGNSGKVRINLQGRMKVVDCVAEGSELIESGTKVKVTRLLDGHLLVVEPVK